MALSEKIYICRRKQGLSQEGLAARLNVSRQAVSKWETGDAEPESGKLIALAQTFGVTVDWLLGEEDCSEEEKEIDLIRASAVPLTAVPNDLQQTRSKVKVGYFIYLGCLLLFLLFGTTVRFGFSPDFSWQLDFSGLGNFFDPMLLCAMLAGCILLLYGSGRLRSAARAFRFMVLQADKETDAPAQIAQSRRAAYAALVGWLLGGAFCTIVATVDFMRRMDLTAEPSYLGSIGGVLLNFLLYGIIGLFVLLPVAFSLKQKEM